MLAALSNPTLDLIHEPLGQETRVSELNNLGFKTGGYRGHVEWNSTKCARLNLKLADLQSAKVSSPSDTRPTSFASTRGVSILDGDYEDRI